jgi:non-canonical purine NTP pyrophosphatase (RdgB/HAM1 family)
MKHSILLAFALLSIESNTAQYATGGGVAPMNPEAAQTTAVKVVQQPTGRIGTVVKTGANATPKMSTAQVTPAQVGATGGGIAPMTSGAVQAATSVATGVQTTAANIGAVTQKKTPLYFVTGNAKKLQEVTDIFKANPNYEIIQLNVDLIEIQETDGREVIKAKVEQAFKEPKVQEMFNKNGRGAIMIEDTSLYFDALQGKLPGPLIKWFDHAIGNEGEYALCKCANNFNARATAWIGYATGPEKIAYYEGTVHGTIVEPKEKGYGWDPIFKPVGSDQTFAGMTPEQKNATSMRGMAVRNLLADLAKGTTSAPAPAQSVATTI